MTEKRFENYITDVEKTISCEQFLEENQVYVNEIQSNKKFKKELKIYKALSKKKRLLILRMLEKHPMCTCALAKVLGTTDGAITHHLNILRKASLIFGHKKGYYTIYHTKENLQKFLAAM